MGGLIVDALKVFGAGFAVGLLVGVIAGLISGGAISRRKQS